MATTSIEELLLRLEEQQARIERLEAGSAKSRVAGDSTDSKPAPAGVTRRGMVKTAAAGAAGVVGAILIEPADMANAATASGPGTFTSSTGTPAVTATNTGTGGAITATAQASTVSAIVGTQKSGGAGATGVQGTIAVAGGAGTGVQGTSPHGVGVRGTSTSGTGVAGTSSTGTGVTGFSTSTGSGAAAVKGTISSTSPGSFSAGIRGVNNGTGGAGIGVYGSQAGAGWGVYGTTPTGAGVYGVSGNGTGVHGTAETGGIGVLGDTSDGNGYGVYGQADNGVAVYASTDSGIAVQGNSGSGIAVQGNSGSGYGVYGNSPGNYAVVGVTTSGTGVYGQVATAPQSGVIGRTQDSSGNWAIYGFGNIGASGTKSAVVPAEDGGHLTLYCMESPECWFEDFGSGKLSGGSASVRIDSVFAQTIHTNEYHVFLQAEGECDGLCVLDKTATGFTVRELRGGTSDVSFAYRIVALRKDVTAPRLNRITLPHAPEHIATDAPAPALPHESAQGR